MREAAVAYARWCRLQGQGAEKTAHALQICSRTLRRWQRRWREDRLELRTRGRPIEVACAALRAVVFATLAELGPGIGAPTLRCLFPGVGKRELEELVRRYRHAHRRGRRIALHALRWTRPGAVWAIDFSEPPVPIHGLYDQVLCVRDLASTYQLWALPMISKDSRAVIQTLAALTRWHGAPLVLKLDNDGVFRASVVKAWAERHGVRLLYSPPRWPRYNGSVECGIGTLKVHAHYASALHDRPGEWTIDDIELARRTMNDTGRPRGIDGPNPNELWEQRERISTTERGVFQREYSHRYGLECARRGLPWGVQLQHAERSEIDRAAIAQAMTRLGFLLIRRRRITLPVRQWRADKITK